ncbi:single-stranded DNA-binding protein [Corynebacterium sp. H128]|uniref:single-stranded DNA-binding protein n=1 Tax=unclassified Corynebacterium TaxID=2624378 RepID=UPI00309E8889
MAGETVITVVGNLVADPELRFTPSGAAVANFRIASTPRTFDRNANQWVDGDALFLACNVWRQAAENVAETLTKGMRVIVQGRLKQRSYETREGEKRTVYELEVDEVGPSLKYATAQVNRATSGGQGGSGNFSGGNFGGGSQGAPQAGAGQSGFSGGAQQPQQRNQGGFGQQGGFGSSQNTQPVPENDPWNSAPPAGGGFGGADDEPPF